MLADLKREHNIRRTSGKLSRQRVALVLQPGNLWVIEKALEEAAETDAALKTCHMRGWVEPLESAIPRGKLTPDGRLPENFKSKEQVRCINSPPQAGPSSIVHINWHRLPF
jgi:hypothetical protein